MARSKEEKQKRVENLERLGFKCIFQDKIVINPLWGDMQFDFSSFDISSTEKIIFYAIAQAHAKGVEDCRKSGRYSTGAGNGFY